MRYIVFIFSLLIIRDTVLAQDYFEIQVYPSETVPKGATMVELHSNYTFAGTLEYVNSAPTHHQLHETIEITHGFSDIFELGFYLFTAMNGDGHYSFAGSHIRPRIRAPESWKLPVGLSLSTEIGYISRDYTSDDWSWEIRPIIDKKWNRLYIAVNPAIDKSFHGSNQNKGFDFAPDVKLSYNFTSKIAIGFEYYGDMGQISRFDPVTQQQHQVFAAVDLDYFKDWEINAGYGFGLTQASPDGVLKLILGYKFGGKGDKKNTVLLNKNQMNYFRLAKVN